MPTIDRLQSNRVKRLARQRVVQLVTSAYSSLYDAIFDVTNKYETPALIAHYKPEQLETLLDSK